MNVQMIHNLAIMIPAAGLVFLAAQAFPVHARMNPPVRSNQTLEAHSQVPGDVGAILDRACADCHSNATRWPWYSKVAPMSWLIAHDVERGRKAMNFSEWSARTGERPEVGAALLAAACANAKQGRMPPTGYRQMHPEARLSQAEISTLCSWTQVESKRLMKSRRANAHMADVR